MGSISGLSTTDFRGRARSLVTFLVLLSTSALTACSGGSADSPPSNAHGASTTTNRPPIVDAGKPQAVQGGGIVLLKGSATDPEGNYLSHAWRQIDGPGVVLNDADSPIANFETPTHMPTASLNFELQVTDVSGGSSVDSTNVVVTTGYTPCAVTIPSAVLGVDPWFYEKYCDANGQPVLAPHGVSDIAVQWVRYQALEMLKRLPLAAQAMILNGGQIAIKEDTQVLTQIPEYGDLYTLYPDLDWDLLPGVGAVMDRPVTSTTEENVLCYEDDVYKGFSVFIHEFAHSIHLIGLATVDPTFEARLKLTFETAMASGLWDGEYAAHNYLEYWAEGVTIWFNAHWSEWNYPGVINTREKLAQYDDGLYRLIREYFTEDEIAMCPPAPL